MSWVFLPFLLTNCGCCAFICCCLLPMTELHKNLKKRYSCCTSCQNCISLTKMNERERHLLFPLQSQVQRQCLELKFARNTYRSKAAICGIFPIVTDASWINLTSVAHRPLLSFINMFTFAEQMKAHKQLCLTLQ